MNLMQAPNVGVGGKDFGGKSEPKDFICGPKVYGYNGWTFEISGTGEPWPLKNDGFPRARAGLKFYKDIGGFLSLDDRERENYRISGGCRAL